MFHLMSISIILTEKAIRKQVCTLVKMIPDFSLHVLSYKQCIYLIKPSNSQLGEVPVAADDRLGGGFAKIKEHKNTNQ